MTSIKRQILRSNPNYENPVNPQLTEDLPDGGYRTLNPTKGWMYTSARRVKARETMAQQFGFIR